MISEFPLFVFTTLGGIAAGAYVARAIAPLRAGRKAPWLLALVALVMLGIGGVALLLHLGHPERVLNAFSNPGAGITQEGVTTVLFGLAVVADLVMCATKKDSPRWLVAVAAVLGAAMTVTMGLAYFALVGTPAWANAATVPFFVVGDLAMGAGFYLLFRADALADKTFSVYNVAAQALAAVSVGAVCAHFAGLGYSVAPFVVGIVGAALAAVLGIAGRKGGNIAFAYLACACALVGIAVARYAFYAASVI
ncbi:MAG: dimethyl sulfoxide reductase anchor subunit [Eggerthellaceae bacterium]|nr:dimethyl sulfoxide reductase anchor subunit [Eggerthellaceae bacterium]